MADPLFPYSQRRHADPVPGQPALDVRNLVVAHPGTAVPVLRGVNLCVPIGARIALIGANGAGKSTLLKAIAGLLPYRSGDIRICGQPIGACHHRVAYLPQRGDIDWRFPVSVYRLVMSGRYVHLGWLKPSGKLDRQIVNAAIEQLGLTNLMERQIGQLSGGQQQRAMLARALAQEAEVLLLDEPLNAVDATTRQIIGNLLAALHDQGKTVIVATHDLNHMEKHFDGALYLSEGCEAPPPAESFSGLSVGQVSLSVPLGVSL